jgi:hypothetical protein
MAAVEAAFNDVSEPEKAVSLRNTPLATGATGV